MCFSYDQDEGTTAEMSMMTTRAPRQHGTQRLRAFIVGCTSSSMDGGSACGVAQIVACTSQLVARYLIMK